MIEWMIALMLWMMTTNEVEIFVMHNQVDEQPVYPECVITAPGSFMPEEWQARECRLQIYRYIKDNPLIEAEPPTYWALKDGEL